MLKVFIAGAVILGGLSWLAHEMIPPPAGGSRTTLVWSTDNNPVRQEQVDLFNKMNPDLYLVIDPNNTDQQKVIVQSLGGVGPDIFDTFGATALHSYVRSGVAKDVTTDLEAEGIRVSELIWPVGLDSCMFEDRVYGFPANTAAGAIWFNKDIFDAEGVPYPKSGWTWPELLTIAQKLTKRDRNGRITRFGMYWDFNLTWELVRQFGGRMFTEDQTKCLLDSPEAIAAGQLSADILYKYNIAPTPVQEAALATQGGWGTGGITYLMGGRVAMSPGGRWWLNLMRKEPKLNLGVVEMPYQKEQVVVGGARVSCVNANGKHVSEAVRFIKFLASREYNELINEQADALASVKKYCYTDEYLLNPKYPKEDYNAIWRTAAEKAVPGEVCSYLPGGELSAISNQLDLLKNNVKTAAEAFRQATKDANERIIRNARRRPYLRELFMKTTGREP